MNDVRKTFVDECYEGLEVIENGLHSLKDGEFEVAILKDIFRGAHSIKGGAAVFGYSHIAEFTDVVEDLLDKVSSEEIALSATLVQLFFKSVECLRTMVECMDSNNGNNYDKKTVEQVKGELKSCLEISASKNKALEPLHDTGDRRKGDRRKVSRLDDRRHIDRRNAEDDSTLPDAASMRVDTKKIEELYELIEDLSSNQSMLNQFSHIYRREGNVGLISELEGITFLLESSIRDLQTSIFQIRMLPLNTIFIRYMHLVEELNKSLNKNVQLKLSGGDIEVDKSILEKLSQTLAHLIRNAVDHGIETQEQREALGKNKDGIVHVCASTEDDKIVIKVIDDGAGLNRENIYKKALEQNIDVQGPNITDQQLANLIFHPGFSTAEVVTIVSGKGFGLDLVRKNMDELGAEIEVKSIKNQGCIFKLSFLSKHSFIETGSLGNTINSIEH